MATAQLPCIFCLCISKKSGFLMTRLTCQTLECRVYNFQIICKGYSTCIPIALFIYYMIFYLHKKLSCTSYVYDRKLRHFARTSVFSISGQVHLKPSVQLARLDKGSKFFKLEDLLNRQDPKMCRVRAFIFVFWFVNSFI